MNHKFNFEYDVIDYKGREYIIYFVDFDENNKPFFNIRPADDPVNDNVEAGYYSVESLLKLKGYAASYESEIMSDFFSRVFYAVDVRNMQTAIHELHVSEYEDTARRVEGILNLLETFPASGNPDFLYNLLDDLVINNFEINYRDIDNGIYYANDCAYIIVNSCAIDIY